MDKLVLIDGNAILHRAYHAYPPLTTSKGELINAVYGFTSILLTVLRQLKPKYVAVTFDKKAPTFRHKEFKAYKAHRPKMDEELVGQIARVHEVVATLNMPIFEVDGFEADDVIGTLAKQITLLKSTGSKSFSSNGALEKNQRANKVKSETLLTKKNIIEQSPRDVEVVIVTGDYDAVQLVNDKVKVFMPPRGKKPAMIFDTQAVLQKYGFSPSYIVDFKALAGDASDGIPGVAGIGPKTASELINKFGTLEQIYSKSPESTEVKKAVADKLIKDKDNAFLSKKLATIVTNVPVQLDLEKCRLTDYDKDKAIKLFEALEFRTLIYKLPHDGWDEIIEDKPVIKKEKEQLGKKEQQMGLF
jgi:DNA polymerase-1